MIDIFDVNEGELINIIVYLDVHSTIDGKIR